MKLSEAILLSIGVVKENRRKFLHETYEGPCGCAIGTGLWSVGHRDDHTSVSGIFDGIDRCEREWPWTKEYSLGNITIAHRISKRHIDGESRESLAQWIATLEQERGITDGQSSPQVEKEVKDGEHAVA